MASVRGEVLILFSTGAVLKHFRNVYIFLLKRKKKATSCLLSCSDEAVGLVSFCEVLQQPVVGIWG